MSLFSKKPRTVADFEREIDALHQKKKLSKRNATRLEEYESQLSDLKAAEAAEQEKKLKQRKITIGAAVAAATLLAIIITIGCISESKTPPSEVQAGSSSDSYVSETVLPDISDGATSEAGPADTSEDPIVKAENAAPAADSSSAVTLSSVPAYSGSPYVTINNNIPYFTEEDYTTDSYEYYSELDSLGRCGVCVASIGKDLMPTEERGSIGSVKPTGWQTIKYDSVDGKYLYNRCHLIGYQLSGENANTRNLITGTRYLNVQGMLPFENMVADYVKETGNHVLYRATPIFDGNNLLASGVLLEGFSVEDKGDGICFNVFCYNVQPGISIDYASGDSSSSGTTQAEAPKKAEQTVAQPAQSKAAEAPKQTEQANIQPVQNVEAAYILNTNTKKFHLPGCSSVSQMNESNKQTYSGNRDALLSQGYDPCKKCNP